MDVELESTLIMYQWA